MSQSSSTLIGKLLDEELPIPLLSYRAANSSDRTTDSGKSAKYN